MEPMNMLSKNARPELYPQIYCCVLRAPLLSLKITTTVTTIIMCACVCACVHIWCVCRGMYATMYLWWSDFINLESLSSHFHPGLGGWTHVARLGNAVNLFVLEFSDFLCSWVCRSEVDVDCLLSFCISFLRYALSVKLELSWCLDWKNDDFQRYVTCSSQCCGYSFSAQLLCGFWGSSLRLCTLSLDFRRNPHGSISHFVL